MSAPTVAWCATCKVGHMVTDVSTDDTELALACGHERTNPLFGADAPKVCCCASSPIGWSSQCPLPEHYSPKSARR